MFLASIDIHFYFLSKKQYYSSFYLSESPVCFCCCAHKLLGDSLGTTEPFTKCWISLRTLSFKPPPSRPPAKISRWFCGSKFFHPGTSRVSLRINSFSNLTVEVGSISISLINSPSTVACFICIGVFFDQRFNRRMDINKEVSDISRNSVWK